jgi:hypothetical protein
VNEQELRRRIEILEELMELKLPLPSLPSGQLLALPNDNVRQTVLSVPTNQSKPYFIVITLQTRNAAGLNFWQQAHVCVAGDPVTPVIVPSIGGGDFQTTQAGYGASPTLFIVVDPVNPNINFQVANPVAQGAAIDTKVTVDVFDIGPP